MERRSTNDKERMSQCWCGNSELELFSEGYMKCARCGTLISRQWPEQDITHVVEDDADFYGKNYWFHHQEKDLGFPNILARARSDLAERNLYWLRTLLRYRLPPAHVLELGCCHGGFVALLRWTGFDAAGLELSPWVVDFANRTFGIPMLLGPVEDQAIEKGSLDVIALMDVMEHLPDPVGSMRHCLSLLKPDGIFLVQTPSFPRDKSYLQMEKENDPFQLQLKREEHLYLFSQDSIRDLFRRLGVAYMNFEPAIFSLYDMFLVVSRMPLTTNFQEEIEKRLSLTLNGRMVQALLDLSGRNDSLNKGLQESEADRAARLEAIYDRERQIQEIEEDRRARLKLIMDLEGRLGESDAGRAALAKGMETLQKHLEESEKDRAARLEVIRNCERQIQEIEADRAARLEAIRNYEAQIEEVKGERDAQLRQVEELGRCLEQKETEKVGMLKAAENLDRRLQESEADRALRLETIRNYESQIEEIKEEREAQLKQVDELERRLQESEADRALQLGTIRTYETQIREVKGERDAQLRQVDELERRLQESEADRAARLEGIRNCERQIQEIEADRAARLKALEDLGTRLIKIEEDRAARLLLIHEQTKVIEVQRAELIRSSLMRKTTRSGRKVTA